MAKFTKGDWVIFENNIFSELGHFLEDRPSILICMMANDEIGDEEVLANQRLIAAAPHMFKALKKAIKDYGKPGGPWNISNEPSAWIELAKAAIDAAEGK